METVIKGFCCTCEIVRKLYIAFPRSQKKVEVEYKIQAFKASTTESTILEKPTAEGKQKESLIIYFQYILNRIF